MKDSNFSLKNGNDSFHGSFWDILTYYPFVVASLLYYIWILSVILGITQFSLLVGYIIPLEDIYLEVFKDAYLIATVGYAYKSFKSRKKRFGHLFVFLWLGTLAAVWGLEIFNLHTFDHNNAYVIFCSVAISILVIRGIQLLIREFHLKNGNNGNNGD